MRYTRTLARVMAMALVVVMLIAGCATKELTPVAFPVPTRQIDYLTEVKPVLDKRCVVCHSCYNSPCQLKLSEFEGVDRGATKKAVYDGARLRTMEPTRLFIDALSTQEWRKKSFFSVTDSTVSKDMNDSIMMQLLSHKMKNPQSKGEYRPETEDLSCAADRNEVGEFLKKHPNRGMPLGFPALKQQEFEVIAGWLVQGARGPDAVRQAELETPKASDTRAIVTWESFLNGDDAKHAMTARYLFEHLFLAHIKFGTTTNEFYELVRSRTAPGQPIEIIPTVRPYDAPGVERVFYRFRKIHSTIVHKTHMVVEFDDAALQRYQELFIRPEWLQPPHLVGYDSKLSANPFAAFRADPAALALPVPAGQRELRDHDVHPRTGLQGPDRPERDRRSFLDHVHGPGPRPERPLSGLPQAASGQADHAHRTGKRHAGLYRPDR